MSDVKFDVNPDVKPKFDSKPAAKPLDSKGVESKKVTMPAKPAPTAKPVSAR